MALQNKDIRQLRKTWANAEVKLEKAVRKIDPRRSFTQNRVVLLREIREIQKVLSEKTNDQLLDVIERNYKRGSNSIVKDLRENNVDEINATFTRVDEQAVNALYLSVQDSFETAMQGITRTGISFLSQLQKEQVISTIGAGIREGLGPREIKRNIIKFLDENGFVAFVDRSGRRWKLSTYAEMLARTTVISARNDGQKNRLLQNDFQFGKISVHDVQNEKDICFRLQGKIVDLTEPETPTPPFHPNCRHTIQYIDPLLVEDAKKSDFVSV